MAKEKADTRFSMVKGRHKVSFDRACQEKKADEKMVPLCKFIAKTKNYFTSSGCAGRILLLGLPKGERKGEAYFHRKWHRKIKLKEVTDALKEETKGEIWFKLEPFILHIGTNSLENVRKILGLMTKSGIKRGGMIVAKEGKFLVELQGTQEISVPVKKGKGLLVEESYLKFLVEKANDKLEKNYVALKRFEKNCRKELK